MGVGPGVDCVTEIVPGVASCFCMEGASVEGGGVVVVVVEGGGGGSAWFVKTRKDPGFGLLSLS